VRRAIGAETVDEPCGALLPSHKLVKFDNLTLLKGACFSRAFSVACLGGREHVILSRATVNVKEEKPLLIEAWYEGKRQRIEISEPPDMGGLADRWTPLELLSISLAACELITAMIIARKLGVELGSLRVDVEAEWQLSGAGLRKAIVRVSGYKDRGSVEDVWKHVERICPVLQLLKKAGVEVITVFE